MLTIPWRLLLGAVLVGADPARIGDYIEQGLTLPSNNSTSNSGDDACYSSWQAYWSANTSIRTVPNTFIPNTTVTTVITTLDPAFSGFTGTETSTITETSYVINGPFTLSTVFKTSTYTRTEAVPSYPASNRTFTRTKTQGITVSPSNTVPQPTCTLPTIVPQCESSWDQFITAQLIPTPSPPSHCDLTKGAYEEATNPNARPACARTYGSQMEAWRSSISATPTPLCSQASVGGELCQSVRDSYQQGQNFYFQPDFTAGGPGAFFFNGGSLGAYNGVSTSWTWPTSSTLNVPSCTLGCGRCAITGGTVQLLWWPPATQTDTANREAATFVTDNTTLTSPTLYISYSKMHAQNGCGDVGSTITSTIIPIPTSQALSSVWGFGLPCDAHQRNPQDQYRLFTASFNVTDMVEPVPESIYTSMPRCATEMHCGGTCKRDGPYKPILVVPHDVLRDIQPAWADCFGDLNGVYDPPIALQKVSTIAGPTVPGGGELPSPTAQPGGSVQPISPPITNDPSLPTPAPETGRPADPPANDPPTNDPPAKDPPTKDPPTKDPPPSDPPANNPPTNKPPSNGPPSTNPSPSDPSANNPPANNLPVDNTPANDSPANKPPANNSPANGPPANNSPANDPPSNNAPSGNLPSNNAPTGNAPTGGSANVDPAGSAPANNPPGNIPPTDPSAANGTPAPGSMANDPPAGSPPSGTSPSPNPVAGSPPVNDPSGSSPPQGIAPSPGGSSDPQQNGRPPGQPSQQGPTIIPLDPIVVSINSGTHVVIGSSTLNPGGPPIIVSSTTYSLQASTSALVVNGQTRVLQPTPSDAQPAAATALTFAAAQVTVSPASNGQVIKGQSTTVTVSAGAPGTTVDGVPISVGSSGQLVIGTSTTTLPEMTAGQNTTISSTDTSSPRMTDGSQTPSSPSASPSPSPSSPPPSGSSAGQIYPLQSLYSAAIILVGILIIV